MIKLKDILEQGLAGGMAGNTQSSMLPGNTSKEELTAVNDPSLKCIPKDFRFPVYKFKQLTPSYSPILLRASLGIIGRESSFASGTRYAVMSPIKIAINAIGKSTSIGPAQMTQQTQDWTGIIGNLADKLVAIQASYAYLAKTYKLARKEGYSNSPSINLKNGTGNSALDMAIASYNIGVGRIKRYCNKKVEDNKSEPGLKVQCDDPNAGEVVPNYIPDFKTQRWDGVNTTTHGYVKEVADWYKKSKCV